MKVCRRIRIWSARICEALSIPVQLGGGIRDEETAHRWLDAGVARLIIGTLALEDPARFAALCHACPGRIGVSLDAENGRLKTRGWVGDTPYTVDDVVPRLAEDGAAFLVYTDIERDGMQTGVNVPADASGPDEQGAGDCRRRRCHVG